MSTQTALVGDVKARWPWVTRCRTCREQVVIALNETGGTVILDAVPVLAGAKACPYCHGRRRRKETLGVTSVTVCHECANTGVRGEPLTAEHVVMRLDGTVRSTTAMVAPWDSAYHRHDCGA